MAADAELISETLNQMLGSSTSVLVNSSTITLTDVRVISDPRTNGVLASTPAVSIELVAELTKQLDPPLSVVAEVKVFTLSQGDAEAMGEMLVQLFGQQQAGHRRPSCKILE